MREQFPAAIGRHRLRREIVATYVTNNMINRLRPTFVWQVSEETKTSSDVARAYAIIRDTFDLRRIWEDIEALDNKLAAGVQYDMMISVGTLLERAVRWLLRSEYAKLDIAARLGIPAAHSGHSTAAAPTAARKRAGQRSDAAGQARRAGDSA